MFEKESSVFDSGDNWYEKEKERERNISAWDLDDNAQSARSYHESHCEANAEMVNHSIQCERYDYQEESNNSVPKAQFYINGRVVSEEEFMTVARKWIKIVAIIFGFIYFMTSIVPFILAILNLG